MSVTLTVGPIRSDEDLTAALKRLNEIWEPAPGSPEEDEAEVLTVLIQSYEKEHYPIGKSDPVDVIRFHMERLGLRNADLIPCMGASSRVSEVLGGKRKLTVEMIAKLSRRLGIPADDLLPEIDD